MFVSDHWHSELKFDNLRRRLRAMPMLFVTLLFIAGILLANSFIMPLWCAITVAIVLLLGAVLSMPRHVAYAYLIMAIVLMGYLAVEARSVISDIPQNEVVEMKVSVVSPIAEREGCCLMEKRPKSAMATSSRSSVSRSAITPSTVSTICAALPLVVSSRAATAAMSSLLFMSCLIDEIQKISYSHVVVRL